MKRDTYEKLSSGQLEEILCGHITGAEKIPPEQILQICTVLARREGADGDPAGIYRRCLEHIFPDEMKNDL